MKNPTVLLAGCLLAALLALPRPAAAADAASVQALVADSEKELAAGRFTEAAEFARRAIDVDPAWAPAWRQQGLALLRGGKAADAVPAFRRAIALKEEESTAWRGLALALWQTEQRNEAVEAMSAYLRLKADDAGAWRDLANWLVRLDRHAQALPALERVTALAPDDGAAWRQYGLTLAHTGKPAEAAAAFRRAIERNAQDDTAWRGLAGAQWKTDQQDAAVEAMQAYLKLKPEDSVAWRDLAGWLMRLGRAEQAVPALERVLRMNPDDVAAWRELGVLHLRQGRHAESVKAFDQALKLKPDDATVLRDLGWALWTLGRRPDAVKNLEKAVDLDVPARDRVILQVVARLAEEGASAEALAFYRRTRAGAPLADVALDLARRGRLQASEPLLAEAWKARERPRETGLYLSYVRAVNGRSEGVGAQLAPFIETVATATPEELELALETLRLSTTQPELPELMSRLEAALGNRPATDARITAILEKAADEQRVRGAPKQALTLFRRVLERDPNRPGWIWAYLLAEEQEGPARAAEWLAGFSRRATAPVVRTAVEGVQADRDNRPEAAVTGLRASVQELPAQPALRQILFRNLVRLGRLGEARAEALWFAAQVDEGETSLRSYLAEMWTRLGETEEALIHWRLLHLSRPEMVYYGVETAHALYRLGRPEEALTLLKGLADASPDARVFELMAEITAAQGRHAEAVAWAAKGLTAAPSQGLLRYHAENTEVVATNLPAALASARTFLDRDAGYVPMNLLAGRVMDALGQEQEVRGHYRHLLQRNPVFLPALNALRDYETKDFRYAAAVELARTRTEVQPEHPEAWRQYANSLAQYDRFVEALETVRRFARLPVEHAMPVLVYDRVTDGPYPARTTVAQIAAHVERLAKDGYVFVNDPARIADETATRRVMIILINPEARVVRALDPVLEKHGARVVFATHAGLPAGVVQGAASPDALAPLMASGRWRQASSGPEDLRAQPVTPAGVTGNPLTHPIVVNGGIEDATRYAERLDRLMQEAARPVAGLPARLLVYPSGDFGHRSLDAAPANLDRLREAVGRQFTHAVYFDDSGFCLPGQDPLRMPARVVPPSWDADALAQYLRLGNPLARARLELARILYWHGQHETANAWFARAEQAGADPLDVNFNWGLSAARQGDLPTALDKLAKARELDPGSERIVRAMEQVKNRQRPAAHAFAGGWEDNEDRSQFQYGAYGDAFLNDHLRLGLMVDRNRWETDGLGEEEGTRLGARALAYLHPEVWLEGNVWRMDMDDLNDFSGGSAALRVPNPLFSGFLTFFAAREEIETLEALRADIRADYYALRTYTRLVNLFDLFANLTQTERTDDNNTTLLDGRLVYRLKEWSFASVGWRFRYGDSDRDPPEYWAPEELEQHQLYLNLRRDWNRVRTSLSGEAGYARERDTDWRFVWGARGDLDVNLTDRLSVNGEVGWFEGPVYERLNWRLGLTGRF